MIQPVNKKHARNADILDLQAKGLSYRKIASMVGISSARVGAIVKRDWGNGLSYADVEAFLADMRKSNSIDLEIPIKKLLFAIDFPIPISVSITQHFLI